MQILATRCVMVHWLFAAAEGGGGGRDGGGEGVLGGKRRRGAGREEEKGCMEVGEKGACPGHCLRSLIILGKQFCLLFLS